MYRFMFLLFFCIILSGVSYAATRTVVTRQPYYNCSDFNQTAYYGGSYVPPKYKYNKYASSMFSDLNDLEKYTFNKNFFRENDLTRLERLEKRAFGETQQGDIITRYNNVRNAILSRPKQNYKTSLLRSIGNYFGGQVTGLTPSLNSNNYDTNSHFTVFPYGNSSVTNYSNPWGSGYRVDNYGINTGAGVHILDWVSSSYFIIFDV